MISQKTSYTLIALLALYVSCTRPLDMKVTPNPPKIVINAILNDTAVIIAHLSNSISTFTLDTINPISNGTILIYDNNVMLDSLHSMGAGYYYNTHIPKPLHAYKIVATSPGLSAAIGSTVMPSKPVVSITAANYQVLTNKIGGGQEFRTELTFTLADDPAMDNYYMVQINRVDTFSHTESTEPECIYSSDYILQQNNDVLNQQGTCSNKLTFTDALFKGATHSFKIAIANGNPKGASQYALHVRSISKEYYYYTLSLDSYRANNGNPFSEPVQVYNNINNGFGIFASALDKRIPF